MRFARVLFIGLAVVWLAFAADPFVGTWKLNVAKSKSSSGRTIEPATQTFEATSDGYRITSSRLTTPITLHLDGKDYPANQDGVAASVRAEKTSARRMDDRTIETTFKRGGKAVATLLREVAADGRVLMTILDGVDPNGQIFFEVSLWEKQ